LPNGNRCVTAIFFCFFVCQSVYRSVFGSFVVFAALCCTLVEPQKMLQRNEISVKTMQLEQRLQLARPAHQIHFPFARRVPGLARTCHFALLRATLEILDNRLSDRQTDISSTTMTPSDGQVTGLAQPSPARSGRNRPARYADCRRHFQQPCFPCPIVSPGQYSCCACCF